ncbi:MAG: transporter substrate-binding domain-containing protein [Tissierellia bacterium]|nr:transporter substrate-binding domain-containing protein [Tissierellia bacterium]
MKLRRMSLMILVLVLALAFTACSGGGGKSSGKEQLKVGMECDYAPFNWTQANDANGGYAIGGGEFAGGYDVEIAKRIADSMDKELVIVKTVWDGLTPAITSGKIDLIIAGMSPTKDRKTTIDFSDAYYVSEYVMVVRNDGEFADAASLDAFSNKKVSAQLNTFNYELVDQVPSVQKEQALETFSALMVALESGKIDGYIAEIPAAKSAVTANPNLTYVEFPEGSGFEASMEDASVAVGVNKGNEELLEAVNNALAEIDNAQRESLMEDALNNQPLTN